MSIFAIIFPPITATYQVSAVSDDIDEFGNPTYTVTTNTISLILSPADTREINKLGLNQRYGTDAKSIMLLAACHSPATLPSNYGLGDELTCTYSGKAGTLRIEYVYPTHFAQFQALVGQTFVASFTEN
jgi:hypothetical protein